MFPLPIDELVAELLEEILEGLDHRLSFEAWADTHPQEEAA